MQSPVVTVPEQMPVVDEKLDLGAPESDPEAEVIESLQVVFTEEEAQKVKRKHDMFVLPLMLALFTLNFMDKQAINYGAVWGLKKDLHLDGDKFSWIGSIFYFGYLVTQLIFPPIVHRIPVAKACALAVTGWGIVLTCMPGCKNFAGLAVQRFILGLFEGGVNPAFILLTGMYYTREEHSLRTAVWASGNAVGNVIGSLLGYGFGSSHTSLAKWMLFPIVFGAITLLFGVTCFFFLPNSPSQARYLNAREKEVAVARVQKDSLSILDVKHEFQWYQVREAVTDFKLWLLYAVCFFTACQAPGPGVFGTQIVKSFGFDALAATVLQGIPTGSAQFVFTLGFGWIASRKKGVRSILIAGANVVAIIGAACLFAFPKHRKLYPAYVAVYPAVAGQPLAMAMISSNIGGYTKKSVASVITLIAYCTGQIAGPHFFTEAPYNLGFGMMIFCFAGNIACGILLLVLYKRENARRDRLVQEGQVQDEPLDHDLTDHQRLAAFRYSY